MTATLEGFYMRKDRSVFPVEVNIVVITRAGKNMVVAVARDITERERAEIALRESEELFESLVDNIDLGISLIDSDYTIVAANSAQAHLSDKDADDLCGKKCYREFEKRDAVCTHCPGTKAMATGQSADVETVGTRDDGSHFDVRLRAFPWHGADGATAGFVEVVEDITKLKESQKALQEAKESAEAANCAKSAFLTNMSHEIRTPMTAILGYADLILDAHVERTIQEHAAVIKHYGEHLLKLIGGILDLSKIEAGKLQIEPTRCSLGQVVADVSSLMRAQATAKQLVLKTEFVPPLPETVFTDPLRLRQILVNLVGNAIKFTDQGEISLAVRLSADNGRVRLCFDVTDTGIGMNEEQIGKLFKPFSQADTSNTRKFSGTGLGLCISKHLAETLGGTIKVCSKPGMGSTFSVTIDPGPLDGLQMIVDAWKATTEHPPTAPPTDARKIKLHGRILLAEDMMANQRLISVLLTRAGADVMAVENGQLAVEAALAACEVGKSFDVILMDMQMPVMDGYEATWQLRRQGYTGPIVALTAHAMAEDCQKCLDVGCDDYATKPIDREKFLATIAHWLSRTCGDGPLLQDDAVSCERQNRDARF
jgi:PAS domain S-box-containing protein